MPSSTFTCALKNKLQRDRRLRDARRHAAYDRLCAAETTHAMLRMQIIEHLGEDIYELWFSGLRFENFDGRVVRTSVPAKFLWNWLQSRYPDYLLKCYAAQFSGVERVDVFLRKRGAVTTYLGSSGGPVAAQ